jgi:hypothetical protein
VDNCDYLQLKANKYNLEGMYFNVEKIMERMYGKLRDAIAFVHGPHICRVGNLIVQRTQGGICRYTGNNTGRGAT